MNAPCYGCNERQCGCHGCCDKYKDFRGDVINEREARNKFNYGRSVIIESSLRQTLSKMK